MTFLDVITGDPTPAVLAPRLPETRSQATNNVA